jgi:hypothetical protein
MAALLAEFNAYLDVDDADPAVESRPAGAPSRTRSLISPILSR